MAEEPEDRTHLRPVKVHGRVLDGEGGARTEPAVEPVRVRLVRELKRVGAAPHTLTGCPVELPAAPVLPGPGAARSGAGGVPAGGAGDEVPAVSTGIVRFLLRLLGRDVGVP